VSLESIASGPSRVVAGVGPPRGVLTRNLFHSVLLPGVALTATSVGCSCRSTRSPRSNKLCSTRGWVVTIVAVFAMLAPRDWWGPHHQDQAGRSRPA